VPTITVGAISARAKLLEEFSRLAPNPRLGEEGKKSSRSWLEVSNSVRRSVTSVYMDEGRNLSKSAVIESIPLACSDELASGSRVSREKTLEKRGQTVITKEKTGGRLGPK
jgi:hypothetical protein